MTKRYDDIAKNEFDGVFDDEQAAQMMGEVEKEALPVLPIAEAAVPAWKQKLIDAKARASKAKAVELAPDLAPGIMSVKGDMGTPQTRLEALIEADRKFEKNVIHDELEKATEKALNAEALFMEMMAERELDNEEFKQAYIAGVQSGIGKTLDEVEEMLRERNKLLFNMRGGIQGLLGLRANLLKDATAERRAQALKEDFLYKPAKKEKAAAKAAKTKSEPISMIEKMRIALKASGKFTDEQIEQKLKAFEGKI